MRTGPLVRHARTAVPQRAALLAISLWLTGCRDTTENDYEDLALEADEFEKITKLQGLFRNGRVRVRGAFLATDNCKIYRSLEKNGLIHGWQVVAIASQGDSAIASECEMRITRIGSALQITRCERQPLSKDCERRSQFFTRDGLRWDCKGDGHLSPPISVRNANKRLIWWPCDAEQNADAPLNPLAEEADARSAAQPAQEQAI